MVEELEKRVKRLEESDIEKEPRIRKLEVVVLGDHEYRTTGMADKVDQLATDMQTLLSWMKEERESKEKSKRFLGWLTPRDLGAAVAIVLGTITLMQRFGWLK